MATFTGTLRSNEIYAAVYNMIISQQVFADNIAGTVSLLVEKAKVDGTLYGDTKLYYATDALQSTEWGNDAEATNLLALHRPKAPSVQAITISNFRQISLTLDNYLSKRAFADEGTFSAFNSVMQGWINDTKKIYDSTTYNSFIGTAKSTIGKQSQTIALSGITATGEEKNRLRAQTIANSLANILVEMTDVSRDYNDYGYLRSYGYDAIKVVWNSKYMNEITHMDLPTIFHKDGAKVKDFNDYLPSRYFGTVNTAATKGNGTTIRSMVEQDIGSNHYFAGDLIKTTDTAPANTSYTEDAKVICKILVKFPPYMSAFEVGTSFFNPKSLTENHYLTFGRSDLEYLKNYPMVTISEA
jgi:hypothetical protein